MKAQPAEDDCGAESQIGGGAIGCDHPGQELRKMFTDSDEPSSNSTVSKPRHRSSNETTNQRSEVKISVGGNTTSHKLSNGEKGKEEASPICLLGIESPKSCDALSKHHNRTAKYLTKNEDDPRQPC